MYNESTLFDLSFLEQMQDRDFLVEAVELYLHDTAINLKEMQQALDTGGYGDVSKIAHKLKSSTGLLQAQKLFSTLEAIEKLAIERTSAIQLATYVYQSRLQFNALKTALEVHLERLTITS
ncbi:MAG: hypothetical protein JWP81_2020 [Ferruginibacter sp.]|nr:hypothetical protein [Ferruginibacter sp.]